jgi:tetratricopeptide (TPR) repeat protein
MVPSLFFRPHPFIASIITYTISLILASNLIIDPVIALAGAGNSRWQIAYDSAPKDALMIILAVYLFCSALFLLAVRSKTIRIWFADLTSPVLAEQLRIAMSEAESDRRNQFQSCRLGILFERAGLRTNAARELGHLKRIAAGTIYVPFLEGYVYYRRRQYKKARKAFEQAAAFGPLTDQLRSTFFAAAACSAFAEGDTHGSINLSERSLEFDDNALLARMVKVDAFLRLGKKEAAGEEVLSALRQGLDFELEDKVPLDPEITLRQIFRFQKTAAASAASVSNEDSLLVGRNN